MTKNEYIEKYNILEEKLKKVNSMLLILGNKRFNLNSVAQSKYWHSETETALKEIRKLKRKYFGMQSFEHIQIKRGK